MADTHVVLLPDADTAAGGWTIGGGAGSLHAATNDSNNATYAHPTDTSVLTLRLSDVTVPARAQVRSVGPTITITSAGGSTPSQVWLSNAAGAYSPKGNYGQFVQTAVATGTSYPASPDGSPWTTSTLTDLFINMQDFGIGANVLEAAVHVYYNQAPTAAYAAPTGAITTTTRPTFSWTYSDPEGDPQERYWVKVFTAAQAAAAGFDVDTSDTTWESGEVFSSATSFVIPMRLTNGTTYVTYLKVADVGSGGRWSAWYANTFNINLTALTQPTLTAATTAGIGRVALTITGTDVSGATFELQRNADGMAATSWVPVTRIFDTFFTPGTFDLVGTASRVVYDYESPPKSSIRYRARVYSGSGGQVSDWRTLGFDMTVSIDQVSLVVPTHPEWSMFLDAQLPITTRKRERQTQYEPLGRSRVVVLSDSLLGEEGSLVVDMIGFDAVSFDFIRANPQPTPLLLQTPLGDSWYVELGAERQFELVEGQTAFTAYRVMTIPFVEVDPPA